MRQALSGHTHLAVAHELRPIPAAPAVPIHLHLLPVHPLWQCLALLLLRQSSTLTPPAISSLQGHFQIIMNRKYCPLFRAKLDWLSRMLYVSGVWSYVINAITTPIFMAVRHSRRE